MFLSSFFFLYFALKSLAEDGSLSAYVLGFCIAPRNTLHHSEQAVQDLRIII
jgi:hypothetical protein